MKNRSITILLLFLLLIPLFTACQEQDQIQAESTSEDLQASNISFEEAIEMRATEETSAGVIEVRMEEEEAAILEDYAKQLYLAENNETNDAEQEKAIEEIKNKLDPREIISYTKVVKPFTYEENPEYQASMVALVRQVQDLDKNPIIDDVVSITSNGTAGAHDYTWEHTDGNYDLALDKKSVHLYVKGFFEAKVSNASSSFSLPGFSPNTKVDGETIYLSETIKEEEEYKLY